MVVFTYAFICCLEGKERCHQNNDNLDQSCIGKLYLSINVDSAAECLCGRKYTTQNNCYYDCCKENNIV